MRKRRRLEFRKLSMLRNTKKHLSGADVETVIALRVPIASLRLRVASIGNGVKILSMLYLVKRLSRRAIEFSGAFTFASVCLLTFLKWCNWYEGARTTQRKNSEYIRVLIKILLRDIETKFPTISRKQGCEIINYMYSSRILFIKRKYLQ